MTDADEYYHARLTPSQRQEAQVALLKRHNSLNAKHDPERRHPKKVRPPWPRHWPAGERMRAEFDPD